MSVATLTVRKIKAFLEKKFSHAPDESADNDTQEASRRGVIENFYRAGEIEKLKEIAEHDVYSPAEASRALGVLALDRIAKLAEKSEPQANGTITSRTLPDSRGGTRKYTLYLPPGYENSKERYPVVYLLHGMMTPVNSPMGPMSSDEYWRNKLKVAKLIDRLIDTGAINRAVFVMPDMGAIPIRSDGRNEEFITKDLIPHIDQTYRTMPDRNHRAIDGYSLGARLSVGIATRNPDKFSSVSGHSGIYHGMDPKKTKGLHFYFSASRWDPLSTAKSNRMVKKIRSDDGDVVYDKHAILKFSPPTPMHTYEMWRRGLEMSFIYHSMNFKRAEQKK
ncbi:MAG: esterase family protein [Candidatus Aenigmarchaeota archaeon]|nr:esterase family protein [Candidatus Aenigmarchaeota archaeon]